MTVVSDAAQSPGDVMRRLAELERRVEQLSTARRLEAAAIGSGGMRVKGGRILIQDAAGNTTMTLSTDGLSLEGLLDVVGEIQVRDGGGMLVDDGGDITARGGRIIAEEPDGTDVFRVRTDPAELFLRKDLISDLVEEIVEELLTSQAGEDLAAGVFGQRWLAASANAAVNTSSTSYTSLTGGPAVAGVPVSSSGMMLVGVQSRVLISPQVIGAPASGASTWMGYQISGATSRSPDDDNSYNVQFVDIDERSFVSVGAMAWSLETGLNEGNHTVGSRYRVDGGSETGEWSRRRIVAVGF